MKNAVEAVATKFDVSKKVAGDVVKTVIAELVNELTTDGAVRVSGLGTFTVKTRKERQGRNPKTGEAITIAESKTVGFKVSKSVKQSL